MMLANRLNGNFDPWRAMRALEQQWGSQLAGWFDAATGQSPQGGLRVWTGDGVAVVELELPGVKPESIDVSVQENTLTIASQSGDQVQPEGAEFHLRECYPLSRREIQLPFAIDTQQTAAEYAHGVLRVTVHQPESQRPARIPVKG